MADVGVTRLADITGLDRVGIPTYSAVVPASSDIVTVYNGKGPTKSEAKVGALMEAIERQASLAVDESRLFYCSYEQLQKQRACLDPSTSGFKLHPRFTPSTAIPWIEGFDLLQRSSILVPVELAGFNIIGRYGNPCYLQTNTDGLASGNTLEEAICHALCELIERDAWSLASQAIERMQGQASLDGEAVPYPSLSIRHMTGRIRTLISAFRKAGLEPVLKDVTSDLGVPTVFCSVAEDAAPLLVMSHFGLGTHPDARVAVVRALTEAAQSRVVDIQGVREDISAPDAGPQGFAAHSRRASGIDWTSWYHRASSSQRKLSEVRSYEHADLLDDIRLLLCRIRGAGIRNVIVVELTKPDWRFPVVRIVTPGLESIDFRRTGWRRIARMLFTG